jgi:hypothetical protein
MPKRALAVAVGAHPLIATRIPPRRSPRLAAPSDHDATFLAAAVAEQDHPPTTARFPDVRTVAATGASAAAVTRPGLPFIMHITIEYCTL